jgi:hypothetical protein
MTTLARLAASLFLLAGVVTALPAVAGADAHLPTCNPGDDPDGDGYGWTGDWPDGESCKVRADTPPPADQGGTTNLGAVDPATGLPVCGPEHDPDGDGYGWLGDWPDGSSCLVRAAATPGPAPDDTAPTIDDVDATLGVGAAAGSHLPHCPNAENDPDGDGYGWIGDWPTGESCVVVALLTLYVEPGTHPGCPEIGPDNDGCYIQFMTTHPTLHEKNLIDPDGRVADVIIGLGMTVGGLLGGPTVAGTVVGAIIGAGLGISAVDAFNAYYGRIQENLAWLEKNNQQAVNFAFSMVAEQTGIYSNPTDEFCGGCSSADTGWDAADADCGGCADPFGDAHEDDAHDDGNPGSDPGGGEL